MRILFINKFLYPNGGSETYIFRLGEYLKKQGHEVQYFGMEHEKRCVGNAVNSYTSNMDFHNGNKLSKWFYPIKTIYSIEARKKIRKVLDDFNPDICHLNNFNFQLTPSILIEIDKWRKKSQKQCRIIYTAHDGQLVCPNHLMQNPISGKLCTKCLGGHYLSCVNGKCIHGSKIKSLIGAVEAIYWNSRKIYKYIDVIISPSEFMKKKLATNAILKQKILVLHNFVEKKNKDTRYQKKDYVLYFGRYSKEKGIETLLEVIKELPEIHFVFAGNGPMENKVKALSNVTEKGFLSGEKLRKVIAEAKFTVFSSECFENCPFSVMESQIYGTPVLGANIGGVPELIKTEETGELFESGNMAELKSKIQTLWKEKKRIERYSVNCKNVSFNDIDEYVRKLMRIYEGKEEVFRNCC